MRTVFASLFSIVFVMLLSLTTLALSLRSFVFDANFYVSTLKSQGIFQELEKNPLQFIDLTAQIPQLASIPEQLQQQVVATILPPGWLEKQASLAVQAWLTWLVSGEGGTPEIPIDLRQIRDRLQGPPGVAVAGEVVNAIPNCAPNQQPQLSLTQLPACIPQVFDRSYIIEQVAATLSQAAGSMPLQYDIGPQIAAGIRFGPTFNGRRISGTLIDTTLLLLVLSTIGAWIIAALSGGRTSQGRWTWLGGTLLAGSLMVLGLSVCVYVFGPALIPSAWYAELTNEASVLVRGLVQVFARQLAIRSIIFGAASFILAIALLGVGILPRPRRAASLQYRS
jgi:hypothetical protein